MVGVPAPLTSFDGRQRELTELTRLLGRTRLVTLTGPGAGGKSSREIASALVISLNTVARHVSNIFDKVGAANPTEAAGYAHRHRLAG